MRVERIVQRMSLKQRAMNTRSLLNNMKDLERIKVGEFVRGAGAAQHAITSAAFGLSYDA
jgi:hypothetical protein